MGTTTAAGCYVAETFINQIRFGGLPGATENKTTILVNPFSIDFFGFSKELKRILGKREEEDSKLLPA